MVFIFIFEYIYYILGKDLHCWESMFVTWGTFKEAVTRIYYIISVMEDLLI